MKNRTMSRLARLTLILTVSLGGLPALPAAAGAQGSCSDGLQSSGAVYRICMPEPGRWNGDLVLYAHGYVAFNEPVGIPEDQLQLPDGTSIPEIMNLLGFAFATTSYSTNGLAIREGIEDLLDLVDIFVATHGQPRRVYLGGASEGGLVTALAVERFPEIFHGGLAACGPIGDFHRQINHLGDFRVIFDYFFPEVIPGSLIDIPQEVVDGWDAIYAPAVSSALETDDNAAAQFLRVTRIPTGGGDLDAVKETVSDVLWYNVFGASDASAKLGGQPFGNRFRLYLGSDDDGLLNGQVQRLGADLGAWLQVEAHYQTSGQLRSPLITIHTSGDPVVPYWHETVYRRQVRAHDSTALHTNILVFRHGHCNFKVTEVLVAFALLVLKVSGQQMTNAEEVLPDAAARAEFRQLAMEYGALR